MIERGGKSENDREGNRLETAYVRNSLPYTEIEEKLFVFLISKRYFHFLTEKKDTFLRHLKKCRKLPLIISKTANPTIQPAESKGSTSPTSQSSEPHGSFSFQLSPHYLIVYPQLRYS